MLKMVAAMLREPPDDLGIVQQTLNVPPYDNEPKIVRSIGLLHQLCVVMQNGKLALEPLHGLSRVSGLHLPSG